MIKFFRKIRNNLHNEGRTTKYFAYAIGEIILVVIGILIALSINNRNQDRKDRVQETILLEQLKNDFNSNLDEINAKMVKRKRSINVSNKLLTYIDSPNLLNKDSINYYLHWTMNYFTFDPIMIDLANSGELILIKNQKLKHKLTRWNSDINDVMEIENNWKNYLNNQYIPFLIEQYQFRGIVDYIYNNSTNRNVDEKGQELEYLPKPYIADSVHKADILALLSHPNFEDHITTCLYSNSWGNTRSYVLRERITDIINLIDNELKSE